MMKSIESPRAVLAAAALAAFCAVPMVASAFSVTAANGRSTFNAVSQWAADAGYAVVWSLRGPAGTMDFAASPRDVHDDFHVAVEALVSGAAYGRANVYCFPPSEFQAEATFDDRMRLVYVTGRPTGRRCAVSSQ